MTYKGLYDNRVSYVENDCVFDAIGNTYICIVPNTGAPLVGKCWLPTSADTKAVMELIRTGVPVEEGEDFIVNNLEETEPGKALDACQGKTLYDFIQALDARVKALEDELEPTPEP